MTEFDIGSEVSYKRCRFAFTYQPGKGTAMPALNRVQLIGHLGRDPETRHTASGKKVCKFTVAVNRSWRAPEGETREATDWFNVEAWGRLGEVCQAYLAKGRLVFVEGRLQTDRYEQEGDTRYFTRVVATHMQMLDRRPEEPEELVPEPEPGS